MMKLIIITVAGKATRFNNNSRMPVLKCLYSDDIYHISILEHLVGLANDYDKIIIVGGYLFEDLKEYSKRKFIFIEDKIDIVYNPLYDQKGSMYSLFLGIQKAEIYKPDEITFAEGDLIIDADSFKMIYRSRKDVITINNELIWADKSVVVYLDKMENIHYLYDTNHHTLKFQHDVRAIFNSGQVWKFIQPTILFKLNNQLTETDKEGTNLILIQSYFKNKLFNSIECIKFKEWFNCNTKEDYAKGMKCIQQ